MAAVDLDETARELRLAVGQLVRRVRADTVEAGTLPVPQAAALGWLDREGPMTTADLAAAQQLRHQSVARTVGLLAEAGLVRLTPHPTDGRKQLVAVSAAGRRALQRQRSKRAGLLAQALAERLTPDEQRVVAAAVPLLRRLAEG